LETLDELTGFLAETTADGFRGRLQARGEARAIIRQDGVLPDDAPAFGETIDTDLTEYGFSLLRASLALREAEGNPVIWQRGFVRAEGKRALIFCTQRDHVEGYAETVIDLHRRGFLPSLLNDAVPIQRAIAVGKEWLGPDHPAVLCLPIGVAIHHGRLPGPFLREVEALLAAGILHITIASPTLAQGLNLNAAVLLIPTLYRASVPLSGEEFALRGVVTLLKIGRSIVGIRSNSHAAATTSRHACMADALKARCVLAEVR
jgi:hypothetical protein